MGKLNIDLLGSSFSIEAKEDNQYLQKLLTHYDTITKEVRLMTQNTDPLKIAILSGIMLCDEFYKDKAKVEDFQKKIESNSAAEQRNENEVIEAEKITLKMIQDIDRILP